MIRRFTVAKIGALLCAALFLFISVPAPVQAQGPYPTGSCDIYFIDEAMNGHAGVIALSQDAVLNSENSDVRDFAQALIDEQWALQSRVCFFACLPSRQIPVPEHLKTLPDPMLRPTMVVDPNFDVFYLRSVIGLLQRQLAAYERESLHDPCTYHDLMYFAQYRLPIIRERIRLARLLLADIS